MFLNGCRTWPSRSPLPRKCPRSAAFSKHNFATGGKIRGWRNYHFTRNHKRLMRVAAAAACSVSNRHGENTHMRPRTQAHPDTRAAHKDRTQSRIVARVAPRTRGARGGHPATAQRISLPPHSPIGLCDSSPSATIIVSARPIHPRHPADRLSSPRLLDATAELARSMRQAVGPLSLPRARRITPLFFPAAQARGWDACTISSRNNASERACSQSPSS